MKTIRLIFPLLCIAVVGGASAQVTTVVSQGEEGALNATYDATDLIQGLIPEVLPGDNGWHPANTAPADQLPAFTDGQGPLSGLTGLLNDFPPAGSPAKLIRYALTAPADIGEIRVFTGNDGRDGRIFHTYTVRFSSDWGQTYTDFLYVQSHPSGTLNNLNNNQWRAVLSQLSNATEMLALDATHIEFNLYSVDNTGGQMRDPYDGENPFTATDDGLTAAFVSPLVWEIDVLGTNSPFRILPPRVSAKVSGTNLELTWLSRATNFVVEATTQVGPPAWQALNPQPPVLTVGITNTASIALEQGPRFFRVGVCTNSCLTMPRPIN